MLETSDPIRILIAGGGTGGHLFPGIAIAEAFQNSYASDIRFVGTRRGIEMQVLPNSGFRLYTIPVSGLYRVGLYKKLKSLLKLLPAVAKSFWILLSFRPHLVVGIGGYASGPVLALSILLRKRTILQEQNAFPGMTNRLLGKFVPLSFVPFSGVDHLFKKPVVVGNPVRKAIIDAAELPDKRTDGACTITILGGSQGARILNQTMIDILPRLATEASRLHIIHQTGSSDHAWVQDAYNQHPELESTVKPFFDDIASVFMQSHILISRAGSMVNEIIAIGRASILVPIAVSSGNHQLANAEKMAAAGAAIVIEESQLGPDKLLETIQTLLTDSEKRKKMETSAKALFPGDSARIIVEQTTRHYGL